MIVDRDRTAADRRALFPLASRQWALGAATGPWITRA